MRFRKKPVVIDAELFLPSSGRIPPGVEVGPGVAEDVVYFIKTLEGPMQVSPGDWVITGVKGERYPCKPDIFHMTYEQVDE
jgi:hypothetical protein